MPRTHRTFKNVLDARRLHGVGLRFGIQLCFIGREHYVAANALQFFAVFLQRARIAVEFIFWAKLQPVDKNADHRASSARTGFLD